MPDEAGGSSVELVGLDAALRDSRRWAQEVGPATERAARPFAGRVASRTASRVPVRTGALAASVSVEEVPGEDGAGVSIGEGLDYAGWIEFGGSRGRPHIPEGRYLYPTANEAAGEFAALADDTATATAERFPWSTSPT